MTRLNIVIFSDLTYKLNRVNITDLITDRMHENLNPRDISEFEKYRWLVEMIATEHRANQAKNNEVLDHVSEILEFAKREKIMAEGSSEECIQECDNEEQSLIYTGQAQAYEELITWLSSR